MANEKVAHLCLPRRDPLLLRLCCCHHERDDSFASGAADAIVQQNLANSHAVNDVTSIVFDFRGYDTMGEAFILITAVTGSAVILFKKKAEKEDDKDE